MWENLLLLVSKQVICFKETCKLYFIPSYGSATWLFICSVVDSAGFSLAQIMLPRISILEMGLEWLCYKVLMSLQKL
ncbi:unnamed protein product [Cuscuta campestris]|uniref:Uncharacterized protein n=1 Tax=Cuscuta campestris TaxID=132261 RepID=A0A484NAH6_9ASTE|nr:unnamed protein product [Cuscuta campestris]